MPCNPKGQIMRSFLATISFLFAGFACQSWAADNSDFKPFPSKEGKYTVSFPGKPDVSTSKVKTASGDIEMHVAQAVRGKNREPYTVTYNDVPDEVLKGGADKIFDSAQEGGLAITQGKLLKKTDIAKTDKNPPSRDLEVDIRGTTAYYRMLLVGNRLYVIMAYPDGSTGSAERAKLFLESFKPAKDEPAGTGKR